MAELIYELEPVLQHVKDNMAYYGAGAVAVLLLIYLTRPYSVAIIFYSIEIGIYLFAMHSVMNIIVRLTAWFSNETTFRNIYDGSTMGVAEWTTPWIHFWRRGSYEPSWIFWLEVIFTVIIIWLVRYFRPMKIQKKLKTTVAPNPKKKKKNPAGGEEDDWGVATTRRYTMPDDFAESRTKKKR